MPNSWVCVDANLVIRLVVDSKNESVWQLWDQWDAERRQLAAPTLIYYEVTNALHRYQKQGLISASSVRLALKAALSLPIRLHGEADLHRRALDMAERFSLPAAYDAHYLALNVHPRRQARRGCLASISFAFDPDDEFIERMGVTNPFLDPLNPQSEYAEFFLGFVTQMLKDDPDYAARLESHYRQVKQTNG